MQELRQLFELLTRLAAFAYRIIALSWSFSSDVRSEYGISCVSIAATNASPAPVSVSTTVRTAKPSNIAFSGTVRVIAPAFA